MNEDRLMIIAGNVGPFLLAIRGTPELAAAAQVAAVAVSALFARWDEVSRTLRPDGEDS